LKDLLKFDEDTGQRDCHVDGKIAFILEVADFVDADFSGIFETKKNKS